MNSNVLAMISRINATEFFSRCGTPCENPDVEYQPNLTLALRASSSDRWSDERLEMNNRISSKLSVSGPEGKADFQNWNVFTNSIRPIMVEIVELRIKPAVLKAGIRPEAKLEDEIRWDLISLVQEVRYAAFGTVGFYHHLWEWYEQGRLPCGWSEQIEIDRSRNPFKLSSGHLGSFPPGKLVIH